ncbi:MAG: response regulator, partial [Lachnospiraceae bacterium]|nr:response regulator [Lachnospiraceae bacterium]
MEGKRQILVVDDQAVNRKILCKMLQENYRVMSCSNGEEALELLKKSGDQISAVLLDIMMPVMDGYEVLEIMHKDSSLSRIPVLVTSQSDEEESELKALNFGASDFVSKPYKKDVLKKRLLNLIERREATEAVDVLERDPLTNLYNKQAFCHKVHSVLHRNANSDKRYLMAAFDVVNFKLINDTYGTAEGDNLLKFVSGVLKQVLADTKHYTARVYADQFLIFIQQGQIHVNEFMEKSSKLLLEYPLDMKVNVKLGIYEITDHKVAVNAMCDRAVIAGNSIKDNFDRSYA